MSDTREFIIDFLKRELVGPDPVAPYIQANGEEILIDPPRQRYIAGILFPSEILIEKQDTEIDDSSQNINELDVDVPDVDFKEGQSLGSAEERHVSLDDEIHLANAFLPSAMGFSCYLKVPSRGVIVRIHAAKYVRGEFTQEVGKSGIRKAYFRKPLDTGNIEIDRVKLDRSVDEYSVKDGDTDSGLYLNVRRRSSVTAEDGYAFYTFTLINRLNAERQNIPNEKCFFQVSFSVEVASNDGGFFPYPKAITRKNREDDLSNALLYRNKHEFAIGHGCSPRWNLTIPEIARRIHAEVLPVHEIKPIVPRQFDDLDLSMRGMSGAAPEYIENLESLCNRYEDWIESQTEESTHLPNELLEIAQVHINRARFCLKRMRRGIDLLRTIPQVQNAFELMNHAMLLQQLRYGLKLRKWEKNEDMYGINLSPITYPDINDSRTWPNPHLGNWRPFQIAFILMNLTAMYDPHDDTRNLVDIIWFPTGGGKTEAYLGLTAYTIFLRRLRNNHDAGTTVIMRYTLRLLTAQQFQRAASLICACDYLRSKQPGLLGKERINIGLWVGDLTPNSQADAVTEYQKLNRSEGEIENPFVLLKCPWCGAEMGPVKVGQHYEVKGYKRQANPNRIVFPCSDPSCDFHVDTLPLTVIDEDVYKQPPTLLIGTVDKFAMIPWKPDTSSLFGEKGKNPPELIIQDELHLISGPLGSMVGHYETLISELCKNLDNGIGPKIVASTATISRAREQANSLYNCGQDKVLQFPPQGMDAGDSFFAYEDMQAPGRMYVGIHASASSSHATTQVRVVAALLQSVKSVPEGQNRNPYWTVVNYFNSLRELGHAATLVRADIREYLNYMYLRKGLRKTDEGDPRRFINRAIELTSRIPNSEIPKSLQALEIDLKEDSGEPPVDICLATNMISVGVDVPRLGLMTVIGQPKTTAEYIQATSRVGRSIAGPGLVVTIYNPSKPRDRSHYEHFHAYHDAIYSYVEPTSITPFSSPVRERALHALFVAYVRNFGTHENTERPQPMPDDELLRSFIKILNDRISAIDPEEVSGSIKTLERRIGEWKNWLPPIYGGFNPRETNIPLMFPAGGTPPEEWASRVWFTPTSMRNVDASCEAGLIQQYMEWGADV